MKRHVAWGLVATVVLVGGCAQKSNGTQDSPVDQKNTDNRPAQIINFPDGYFNVAVKCDHHGHLLYSNTRDGAQVAAIADSKTCPADWPTP